VPAPLPLPEPRAASTEHVALPLPDEEEAPPDALLLPVLVLVAAVLAPPALPPPPVPELAQTPPLALPPAELAETPPLALPPVELAQTPPLALPLPLAEPAEEPAPDPAPQMQRPASGPPPEPLPEPPQTPPPPPPLLLIGLILPFFSGFSLRRVWLSYHEASLVTMEFLDLRVRGVIRNAGDWQPILLLKRAKGALRPGIEVFVDGAGVKSKVG
jgi:hypothetical protein